MDDTWPPEWMRGVLELCVLAEVAESGASGTHGYAIAGRLVTAGLGRVKGGTLYPLLNRLQRDGYVSSAWVAGDAGPGRKTFVITEAGAEHLSGRREAWQVFVHRATGVIGHRSGVR